MVRDGAPLAGPRTERHMARQCVRREAGTDAAQGIQPRRRARELHRRREEEPMEVGRAGAPGAAEEARPVHCDEDGDCKRA